MRIVAPFCLLVTTACLLISCTNFGDKVMKDNVEVFFKENITKEQAQKTLDLLYPGWHQGGDKKSVQLIKPGDTVHFRMVINEEKAKDLTDEIYLLLSNEVSNAAFNGQPVNVDLTNNKFETIRTLHYKKMEETSYGQKTTEGNIDVYAKEGVTEAEAKKLAAFLDQLDSESNTKSFQADKDNTGTYIVSMVSDPNLAGNIEDEAFNGLAATLSDTVFNGSPVILQLTDHTFKPFRSFKHE